MDAVDRAFLAAMEDLNTGDEHAVEHYLQLVPPDARAELADMLAVVFASRPPAATDAITPDSPSYQRALEALDAVSETAGLTGVLPGALVELRETRGLTVEVVIASLADRLGLPAFAHRRLDWQYFQLETGQLAGRNLSRRLFTALAEIFGTVADDLAAASEVPGRSRPVTRPEVYARPAGTDGPAVAGSTSTAPDPAAELVDPLFIGGRDA